MAKYSKYEFNKGEKLILLIGSFQNAAITNEIYMAGKNLSLRNLNSNVKNWYEIIESLKGDQTFSSVIMNLTESILLIASNDDYRDAFYQLLNELRKYPHQIHMFKDTSLKKYNTFLKDYFPNYFDYSFKRGFKIPDSDALIKYKNSSILSEYDECEFYSARNALNEVYEEATTTLDISKDHYELKKRIIKKLNEFYKLDIEKSIIRINEMVDFLHKNDFNLAPFYHSIDMVNNVRNFINYTDKGLVFKIYINSERIWAGEISKLIQLFQEYLLSVNGLPVILEESKTPTGVIYTIWCKNDVLTNDNYAIKFKEFTNFVELCSNDFNKAVELLNSYGIEKERVGVIVTKYAKEAKRLTIDIKHEYEAKMLSIRHRLESELVDVEIDNISLNVRNSLNLLDLYQVDMSNIDSVKQPQIIHAYNSIIINTLNGNLVYNENDSKLVDFIDSYAKDNEKMELKTSLDILKDENTGKDHRTTAWTKLRNFVIKIAPTVGEVAKDLLEEYLKHLMFGP